MSSFTILTPPEPWGYGAMLPAPGDAGTERVIHISGWVTRGTIAIGVCGPDGSTIVDERRLPSRATATRFDAQLRCPAGDGYCIVIRTGAVPSAGEIIVDDLRDAGAPDCEAAWAEMPLTPHPYRADWHLHFGDYADSLAGRVRLADLAGAADEVMVPWFGGVLALDPHAEITRAIIGSGTYEPGLLWALTHLLVPGDHAVMAGANVGVIPAFLAHLVGPDGMVIAVEPSPRLFDALVGNIRGLAAAPAVRPVRAALGAHRGSASFVVAPRDASGRGHLGDTADGVEVDVTTIDALTADSGATSIEMILLDVEGSEVDALDGARTTIARHLPVVIAEMEDAAAIERMETRVASRLASLGYLLLIIETGTGATAAFPEVPGGTSWALMAIPPRLQSSAIIDALTHSRRVGADGAPSWVSEHAIVEAREAGLMVTAPDIAWGYLAEWRLPNAPDSPVADVVIEVTAHAESGPAQFVLLDRAEDRITEVAVIPPAADRIVLKAPAGPSERSLILRTGARGGGRVSMSTPLAVTRPPRLNPVLRASDVAFDDVPDAAPERQGGIGSFTDALADHINVTRLDWLRALRLDVAGQRVVDFGAGIGVFASFFVDGGARYLGLEGRLANIEVARTRVPEAEFIQADLRRVTPEDIPEDIDIGFLFGLLYHLDNPRPLLDALGASPARLLIIETQVCDSSLPVLLAQQDPFTENQALDGRGSRPSVPWLINATRQAGFSCIASSSLPVAHPDFGFVSHDDGSWRRDGHNLRVAFVAARDDRDIPAHLVRA